MITIKDIEDIELLQLFFEAFNGDSMHLEELTSKKEIEEMVENKFKVMEEEFFKRLDARLNQHMIMIEESIAEKYLKKNTAVKKESARKTIRKYKQKYTMFTLIDLKEDGTFLQKKGKAVTFKIQDVILLKKLIPKVKEYPTFNKLAKKLGLSNKTVTRLCYLIEIGEFDKWISKWEQMEANNFYGKYGEWKPRFENNPQKRKEQGMV